MSIINRFTIQNLKLNKKRTIVTIIGIILSTALICGVAGLVSSFQQTFINITVAEEGNYHTTFFDVKNEDLKYIENNNKVKSYFYTSQIGWAYLKESKNDAKPYVSVLEYDSKALNNYGVKLLEGRLPENSDEVVISKHIYTNGRVNLKVGDTLKLDIGTRCLTDGTVLTTQNPYLTGEEDNGKILEEQIINTHEKTYKIVGIIERPNYTTEGYDSPGYIIITHMNNAKEKVNASVLYTEPTEYEENNSQIMKAINSENIKINRELLRYQGALGENTLKVLYGIAAVIIAIIIVSSVFVIRNSFSISVAEKNRQYGMMISVGATSKQIKRSVLFEGFIIGIIAIPLGILGGIIAIMILLQVVNYLLGDMLMGMHFVYSIPLLAILISVLLAFITIYLSCLIPAIKASKISPIESIRGNNDIKIKSKKIKANRFIKKLFGIGGVIASKNLKRSRKKYRTTVISIVISIVIFISLSTFISCGNKSSTLYYTELDFNMIISEVNKDICEKLSKVDNVDKYSYYYEDGANLDFNKYVSEFGKNKLEKLEGSTISIMAYNNEYFKQYLKELGMNEQEYKTAVILIDEVVEYHQENNTKSFEKIYNIKEGDNLELSIEEKKFNFKISKNTTEKPMGLENTYYSSGMLIISEDYMKNLGVEFRMPDNLFIHSNNATELENTLNDMRKENVEYVDINILNFETVAEQQNRMVLVIEIFLYGFMTVITLIGVTNIFNTITTNMILRSKEFAMLKSIGMTTKEFNKMIRLESILYGLKSLVIGIPIGVFGSYMIYKSFTESIDVGYSLPLIAIGISIVFVFVIVGATMKYSLSKINKQNIIETIRKDNI